MNQPSIEDLPLINGKRYPMWSSFVRQKASFIGCNLEDHDMGAVATTAVTDITLEPNGAESAYFTVQGEDFSCGFDVQYGGVNVTNPGWINFHGYGGHSWRIERPNGFLPEPSNPARE